MQSVLDAIAAGTLNAEMRLVLSDVPDARILERARNHAIPCAWLDCAPFKTKLDGGRSNVASGCCRTPASTP